MNALPFDVFFGERPPAAPQRELIIDSFAGGGGASTGIEMALGRSPDFAINHDPEALALHAANHPDTVHLSKNVWHVDPLDIVHGAPVGLAWFSPDCKHFSKAKGGRPVKRHIRDLAWVVVHWAKRVRPRIIMLENVEEFRDWGPITAEGKPCPDRKGQTFQAWVAALKRLGYRVEWRELRACDYGAPTIRKRLFLIARRDGKPIVWPEATHGKPTDPDVIAGRKLPWRTAADIIDWSLPCPSIFLTREEGRKIGVNRPLADATMARIAKGVKRYVLDAEKPFIVTLNHQGSEFRGQGTDEPFRTVTASRDAHGVVVPHVSYAQQGGAARAADAPLHTVTASAKDQSTLVAASLQRQFGASVGSAAGEPVGTITAGGGGKTALLSAQLVGCGGRAGQSRPRSADEPTATGTAKADACLVAAHLTKFNTGATGSDALDPVPTVTAAHSEYHPGGAVPLGIVAATMVQTGYGERAGQQPRALDVGRPLGTVVAGGAKHAAVAAFLAQHNTGVVRHQADAPVSTITAGGDRGMPQQAVVSAGMLNLRGSDRRGADVDAPLNTVTGGGTHAAEVRAFLLKYYGNETDGHDIKRPLGTVTTKERFGLVTIEGEVYQIADIGMRMLKPRELYRAQGFPDSYKIDIVFNGKPLPQSSQTRMCGNSVCPPMACALVGANAADLAVMLEAAE